MTKPVQVQVINQVKAPVKPGPVKSSSIIPPPQAATALPPGIPDDCDHPEHGSSPCLSQEDGGDWGHVHVPKSLSENQIAPSPEPEPAPEAVGPPLWQPDATKDNKDNMKSFWETFHSYSPSTFKASDFVSYDLPSYTALHHGHNKKQHTIIWDLPKDHPKTLEAFHSTWNNSHWPTNPIFKGLSKIFNKKDLSKVKNLSEFLNENAKISDYFEDAPSEVADLNAPFNSENIFEHTLGHLPEKEAKNKFVDLANNIFETVKGPGKDYYNASNAAEAILHHPFMNDPAVSKQIHESFIHHVKTGLQAYHDIDGESQGVGHYFANEISSQKGFPKIEISEENLNNPSLKKLIMKANPKELLNSPASDSLSKQDWHQSLENAGSAVLEDSEIFNKALTKLDFYTLHYQIVHQLNKDFPPLSEGQLDLILNKKDEYVENGSFSEVAEQGLKLNYDKYAPALIEAQPSYFAQAFAKLATAQNDWDESIEGKEPIAPELVDKTVKMAADNAKKSYSNNSINFLQALANKPSFLKLQPNSIPTLLNSPARETLVNNLFGNHSVTSDKNLMARLDDEVVPHLKFEELARIPVITPRKSHLLTQAFNEGGQDIDLNQASNLIKQYSDGLTSGKTNDDSVLKSIVNWANTPESIGTAIVPHALKGRLNNIPEALSKAKDFLNTKPASFWSTPYTCPEFSNLSEDMAVFLNDKFAQHANPIADTNVPESYANRYSRIVSQLKTGQPPPPLKPVSSRSIMSVNNYKSEEDKIAFAIKHSANVFVDNQEDNKKFTPAHLEAIKAVPNNGGFALGVLSSVIPNNSSPSGFKMNPDAYIELVRTHLPQVFDETPKRASAHLFRSPEMIALAGQIPNLTVVPNSGYYESYDERMALTKLAETNPLAVAKFLSKNDLTVSGHILSKLGMAEQNSLIQNLQNNPEAIDLFNQKIIQPNNVFDGTAIRTHIVALKIPTIGFTQDVLNHIESAGFSKFGGVLAKNLQYLKPDQEKAVVKLVAKDINSGYGIDPSLKPLLKAHDPKEFIKAFMKGGFDRIDHTPYASQPLKVENPPKEDLDFVLKHATAPVHGAVPSLHPLLEAIVSQKSTQALENDLSEYSKVNHWLAGANPKLNPMAENAIRNFGDDADKWANLITNLEVNANKSTPFSDPYISEEKKAEKIIKATPPEVIDSIVNLATSALESFSQPQDKLFQNTAFELLWKVNTFNDPNKFNDFLDKIKTSNVVGKIGEYVKPSLLEKQPDIFKRIFDLNIPINERTVQAALNSPQNVTYLKTKLQQNPELVTGDKASYLPHVMSLEEVYTGHDHKFTTSDYTNFITHDLHLHKGATSKALAKLLDETDSWDLKLAMRNVPSTEHKPELSSKNLEFYENFDKCWGGFWQDYCRSVKPEQFAKIRSAFFENDKPAEIVHRGKSGKSSAYDSVPSDFLREMSKRSIANVKKHLDLGKFKGLPKERIKKRSDGGYNIILSRGVSGDFAHNILENLGIISQNTPDEKVNFKSNNAAVINELPFTSFSHSIKANMGFTQRGIKGQKSAGIIFSQEVPLESLALCENLGFTGQDEHAHHHELEWMVLNPGGAIVLSPNDILYTSVNDQVNGNKSHPLYSDLVNHKVHNPVDDEYQVHGDMPELKQGITMNEPFDDNKN